MQRLGVWQEAPLPEAAYAFELAFGADTMTYLQWLQFVFVPRVEALLAEGGPWPRSSAVGTQALREFDGWGEGAALVDLLCGFDALLGR